MEDDDTISYKDKQQALFSPESSKLYASTRPEAKYEFDYEINSILFKEEKGKENMYMKVNHKMFGDKLVPVNPGDLYDTLDFSSTGDEKILHNQGDTKLAKANIFKRLVSKKKRRLQTEYFDLDMAYITERVIGMGFPATGAETLYRNSLEDLKLFLDRFHEEYKVYNLCIEKGRIYKKDIWGEKKVGLFPFNDHAPCPIKLILDFCVDICLYLAANPKGVAAIHCKAGKGRTGVMIVSYLIFSGLCQTTEEALSHYASQRTLNNKGVTIPSQIRYIKYFESYLYANYEKPFIKLIPKMIKYDLNKGYKNMILNYNTDISYFTTANFFDLKKIVIGPFSEDLSIEYDFEAITIKKLNFEKTSKISKKIIDNHYYYEIDTGNDDIINYDLKLSVKGKKLKFYCWFNLWFNTYEIISQYIANNNYFEAGQNQVNSDLSQMVVKTEEESENKINTKDILTPSIETKNLKGDERENVSKAFSKLSQFKQGDAKSSLSSIKNIKDLNIILDNIDDLAREKGIELLDRTNLEFTIEKKYLDKLKTENQDEFKIKFTYQLLK
jgi:hypothetical protein